MFDSISSNSSENYPEEDVKTEPVISENSLEKANAESLDTNESKQDSETEFNASSDDLDQEFNQETEEELLDIPTFLRRQAN